MSIEPNDIINSNIKKKIFGGYDTKDVTRLLHTVAQEISALRDQNTLLLEQLSEQRQRVNQFERLETKMIDSINSAEKAKRVALKDVQIQSDAMIESAKMKANFIIQEAESKAQKAMEEVHLRYQAEMNKLRKDTSLIKRDYNAIDSYSDKLLNALSEMAEKTLSEARRLKAIKDVAHSDQTALKIQREKVDRLNQETPTNDSVTSNFFEELNI
ncbi:DivIVA domain-containing protein [Flammeovirga kamogawensis]|uniref:DivIVA domain-containing protein n=1 Tax=Flammeovirga kamogawensis TaxID=373891 RepID=A0ABX8GTX2_9BACT|nr:DivIVA domain-containing protein [Flammeovirga kamogawensis]MBB6459941.1 cell division septum initiation protein DivIVA [Flammeovirga kamogawensis]QWG07006.1 DivIVA domain-containing protein [Flammeovirga kamogawensis]TRX68827.1 hypothetical protein EO216_12135 [Flammeovirga kamogawensis]